MAQELLTTRRRTIAIALFAISAVSGFDSAVSANALVQFIANVAIAVFATMYCVLDADLRGKPLPWSTHWLVYSTSTLSVPVYLLWSRGRSWYLALLAIGLFFLVSYLGYWLGDLLIQSFYFGLSL
jgi:hypothetical protein